MKGVLYHPLHQSDCPREGLQFVWLYRCYEALHRLLSLCRPFPAPVAPLHAKCESVSLADQYLAQLWPVFFRELCELIKTNRIQSIFSIHSGRLFMGSTVAYDTATHLFFSEFEVHTY